MPVVKLGLTGGAAGCPPEGAISSALVYGNKGPSFYTPGRTDR
jgi:hypothetical protein